MVRISNILSSAVTTALTTKLTPNSSPQATKTTTNLPQEQPQDDTFNKSENEESRTAEQRTNAAVLKFNNDNDLRINKALNESAINDYSDIDNVYDKLLPEYKAYKNPELTDLKFTPVSADTVSVPYKKGTVEISCKTLDDGNKQQEINFEDGSQVKYLIFSKDWEYTINGEKFDMPQGTIIETKSVKGKVFSQLIQTPQMQRKVINKPEYFDKAEQALTTYNPSEISNTAIMPEPEFILNLLGKTNISYISKNPALLEKSLTEGRLPEGTSITGINESGDKILTIAGKNCKYEVCGSEMRVIDNSGETKMIARYISAQKSQGLWVVSYDNNKPISASHYASWNTNKPLSTVNYTYNSNNTVTATDIQGNKNTSALPENFSLEIDNGLKFTSSDKSHLGLVFENQRAIQG